MFKYQIHALAMRKAGFGRPFRRIAFIVFLGCLIAGLIYAAVVFHALEQRSTTPHVHTHSTH